MVILHKLRNSMFWFYDFIRGGYIKTYFNEISFVLENFHTKESIDIRQNRLDAILKHAKETTSFYGSLGDVKTLSDFPIINKTIIRDQIQGFKSIGVRSKYKVTTSGSTGTPFTVDQGRIKRNRNVADTIYFAKKAGFKLGSKLIFIRVWGRHNNKNSLLAWMQNVKKQEVADINHDVDFFIEQLTSDNENKGIISHASALEKISEYLKDNKIPTQTFNLNSIIANSEQLNSLTKERLEKQFKIPVVSRYSNVENGILAQQCIDGDLEFKINWASYFIEILQLDSNQPAKNGEHGRIVITDLFNFAMPLIRYDTGDIGSFGLDTNNVLVFETIEGRKLDVVHDTSGEIVPSLLIGGLMKKYPEVIQFQFLQEGKKTYVFKLNTTSKFNTERAIKKEFEELFGRGSKVTIVYTNEIPLLSSGKRRYVVNNYLRKRSSGQDNPFQIAFN